MASFLIVAVLFIRLCFKKASASFRCVLWILVGIRLLVPISISSPFGLVPEVDLSAVQENVTDGLAGTDASGQEPDIGESQGGNQSPIIGENNQTYGGDYPWEDGQFSEKYPWEGSQVPGENYAEENSQHAVGGQVPGTDVGNDSLHISGEVVGDLSAESMSGEEEPGQDGDDHKDVTNAEGNNGNLAGWVWKIATVVWLAGGCVMLLYMLVSYLHLHNSLKEATPAYVSCGEEPVKVYRHESVDSPFLLGILSPKIYVPMKLAGQDLQFVLAHERTHLRRKDHWLKPLSFLVLALYWFHPLVWVAYILLGRDIELACDERVIRENPKLDRAAYAKALLDGAVKQTKIAVCPVAFGEVDVKQRVTNVLNYKKPGFWIALVCAVLGLIVVLCFMTVSGDRESLPTGTEEVQEGEEETGEKNKQNGVSSDVSTTERIAKYQMYYDVISQYDGTGYGHVTLWNYVMEEMVYERSSWYEKYNGEQLQRIAVEGVHGAATSKDIIFYRPDEGENLGDLVLKMLDALITPMMDPDAGNPYTIKEYAIREQQIVKIGDGIWLLPFIDGYYDYDGVDLITMEVYRKSDGDYAWNGLLPFMRQGSDEVFYYLLIEENGIYRLQRAGEMEKTLVEADKDVIMNDPENELIFYYPVNSMNAPGYIPPNEHELIAPDCFWAGGGKVFVDDTANDRILVYQNGLYEKTIALPWQMDVKEMFYVQETDELKVVFNDRNKTGSDYYLAGIDVSSGMLLDAGTWDEEIGNVHQQMISTCFDSEGMLWRDMRYDKVEEPDEVTKQANHIVTLNGIGEFPYAVSEGVEASANDISDSWRIIAKHNDIQYYLHRQLISVGDERLSLSVVMKNDSHVATPELEWNGNPILNLGPAGNIYQMVVDGGGVRIYRLGFAEFEAEDRDDMQVRKILTLDETFRNEELVIGEMAEEFDLLTVEKMRELTADGEFVELVREKGMALFEKYDNLAPTVLYKGAPGASYSCEMDYDGKPYEMTIAYAIDKENPDVKNIRRIEVQALENLQKGTLYSVDASEEVTEFMPFINKNYGVEKCISFTLPEGYELGPYGEQFGGYMASFLEGYVEEKPENEWASEWAVTPGGIGTFDRDSMTYENGEIAGFIHYWTGNHSWIDTDSWERVEGCFTSALITECSHDRFTAPEHYEFMQKYPEIAADRERTAPIRHWYVYICDETMEVGYLVFLNQEYFSKEDAIVFARSVKPLEDMTN